VCEKTSRGYTNGLQWFKPVYCVQGLSSIY
jgi:hypothetical protein